jgi:hypothetical protein
MKAKKSKGIFKESLESISKKLFSEHAEIILELIGDSSGIYALYDDNELYYVGRASNLKRRINQHLKDRHDSQWTHFSLFLIKRDDYIGDIESLLIRIAEPVGNRVRPKGRDSKQMVKKLKSLLDKKHRDNVRELIGGRTRKNASSKRLTATTLKGLVQKRTPIYKTYKGVEYKAFLTPAGTIIYKNRRYQSPTDAAKQIVDSRLVNGWRFWLIENSKGEWVRLGEYK